ncbi:hypothetical protein BKA58DRAFT_95074 [Alternaria rosae]|uniref:uncharacterized protein n=1 Tax=Alternaria rosae TaxID=1187941 RepID=UPI001E8D131F|nr:uncharacterized protein BKA58DRAFT_95074 [Alternaria rosae]KAH6878401.1 hypothetical protein BKA58DRAFT_95074 [Alternaria rosae]
MSSAEVKSLPTLWLAPPPGFLHSPHHPAIEPASIATSALLATLILIFLATFLIKKLRGNFLDSTSGSPSSEHADKHLTISGPLDDVLRRNRNRDNVMDQPVPRLWSGFSSSNEDIERVGVGQVGDGGGREEAVAGERRRRAVELANTPARMPDTARNATPAYPPYPVELDVLPRPPHGIHHRYPDTYAGRPPPPKIPMPQHNLNTHTTSYNTTDNKASSSLPPPLRPAPRNPRYSFGDDTTVVGDKADVETLRSDLSFPDTDSDNASYEEGRWKGGDGKEMGLVGRHWE